MPVVRLMKHDRDNLYTVFAIVYSVSGSTIANVVVAHGLTKQEALELLKNG